MIEQVYRPFSGVLPDLGSFAISQIFWTLDAAGGITASLNGGVRQPAIPHIHTYDDIAVCSYLPLTLQAADAANPFGLRTFTTFTELHALAHVLGVLLGARFITFLGALFVITTPDMTHCL